MTDRSMVGPGQLVHLACLRRAQVTSPSGPTTDRPLTFIQTAALMSVAVHLGVKMADTLSFTAKVDMVDF